jgi:hypothetical protein
MIRRAKVSRLLLRYPPLQRGVGAAIARELGVHHSTIYRDIKALMKLACPCKTCGAMPVVGDDELIDDQDQDQDQDQADAGQTP